MTTGVVAPPFTMEAVLLRRHGGVEELELTTVPVPALGPGECLVRVLACGVEPGMDLEARAGLAGWRLAFPHVLGASTVGEVLVCPGRELAVGARVVVVPSLVCGACTQCRAGNDNACPLRQLLGVHRWGGYAEFVVVPVRNALELPAWTDPVAATALPVSYTTAWHMVVRRAQVEPGERVLVMGASGVVGLAAAQISLLRGAEVTVAARGADKLRRLVELVPAVGTYDLGVADAAREAGSFDVVIDTVGQATLPRGLAVLGPGGRLVSCGAASGEDLTIALRPVFRRNLTLSFASQGTPQDAREVVAAFVAGVIAPPVAGVFPLAEAAQAHLSAQARRTPGKTVIQVAGPDRAAGRSS